MPTSEFFPLVPTSYFRHEEVTNYFCHLYKTGMKQLITSKTRCLEDLSLSPNFCVVFFVSFHLLQKKKIIYLLCSFYLVILRCYELNIFSTNFYLYFFYLVHLFLKLVLDLVCLYIYFFFM